MLPRYGQAAGMPGGGPGDRFGHGAVSDARLGRRGMAHEEGSTLDCGRSHDLEIILDAEIADFQLAHTNDSQGRRLHAAYPNDALCAVSNEHLGRRPRQREVVDLSACWRATAAS